MSLQIATQRLLLEPLSCDAADGPYCGWMNNPVVTQFLECRFRNWGVDDLREFISAANRDLSQTFLGIFYEGRHIGNIKLGPVDVLHQRGDIGLLIGERDHWGEGFATEAIVALCEFGFGELGLHKICAGCYANNIGSCRAFERAGFLVEAVLPSHWLSDGEWVDGLLMGCIR